MGFYLPISLLQVSIADLPVEVQGKGLNEKSEVRSQETEVRRQKSEFLLLGLLAFALLLQALFLRGCPLMVRVHAVMVFAVRIGANP